MRCLSLADELARHGAVCLFVHRLHLGHSADLIERRGYEVRRLSTRDIEPTVPRDGDYLSWLGASEEEDANATLAAVQEDELDWAIVDHYSLGRIWEERLASKVSRIAVIDDLANRPHACDVLIDQNLFPDPGERYRGLVPATSRLLLGPSFALVHSSYGVARRYALPRRGPVRRALVFYGAADLTGETVRALRVLSEPGFADLAVDVVLGKEHPRRPEIDALALSRARTTVHSLQPSLVPLMLQADIAIGSGGATTWERCCMGLPQVVTTIAQNQVPLTRALAEAQIVTWVNPAGPADDDSLRSALQAVLDDDEVNRLACAGWSIVDGCGAGRVTEVLWPSQASKLHVQRECSESIEDDKGRASDPSLGEVTSGVGLRENRDTAIHRGLENAPRRLVWGVCTDRGLGVGWLRIARENGRAVVDYSLHSTFEERGWARRFLELAVQEWARVDSPAPLMVPSRLKNADGKTACGGGGFEAGALELTILSDRDSWWNEPIPGLIAGWLEQGHAVSWVHEPAALPTGDLCFMLGCGQIVRGDKLARHRLNLVVHASNVPRGRGWSPTTWLILEGHSTIPVTLLEAAERVDSGVVYAQEQITLDGTELINEWRGLLFKATTKLCRDFVEGYPVSASRFAEQNGEPSYYRRRTADDSALDPQSSIADQFELLRVVDNDRYPAFFEWRGKRYFLHIRREA